MANDTLFKRRCKLIIAEPLAEDFQTLSAQVTEISDLRISFKCSKSLRKEPNTATIKIYNLAQSTRAQLNAKGAKVILQAGYDDTLAQIFIGDARLFEHVKEGVEWVTTIETADGARAMKFARVSESFKGGTSQVQAIKKIAGLAKVDIGNIDSILGDIQGEFVQGHAAHGIAVQELEKLLKQAGYNLSIQDGALLALKGAQTSTESMIVLNADSGLIGSPEMGSAEAKGAKPLLKVKSLLQPELKPGRRVRVESRNYNGDFRCVKVEHVGDTNAQDWFSNIELQTL